MRRPGGEVTRPTPLGHVALLYARVAVALLETCDRAERWLVG